MPKIAIASSGLGHIARGIETWAWDTACALAERGVDVLVFGAGPAPGDVPAEMRYVALKCHRRFAPGTRRWIRLLPGLTWRWGLKSPHGFEQFSFWLHLWPHLRRGRYDVLHVQDPMLAYWCRAFRRLGLIRTQEVLAHGTNESPEFLAKFDHVQHLAPCRCDEVLGLLKGTTDERRLTGMGKQWASIPNFVDTGVFRPAVDETEKMEIRQRLGIPAEALVIGTVAMVEKRIKRIDYLIREFARTCGGSKSEAPGFKSQVSGFPPQADPPAADRFQVSRYLLIVGARMDESEQLEDLARELIPGQVRFLYDQRRESMPDIYRAMDVFVLTSLFEMMPVAMLEAMASGVPVIAHDLPVLRWMLAGETGDTESGRCLDMSVEGALASQLKVCTPEWREIHGDMARSRALAVFSKDVVIQRYIDYYNQVMETRERGDSPRRH